MVFADCLNRRRLRPLFASPLVDRQPDLATDLQIVKPTVRNAVSMKVDLASIHQLYETEALVAIDAQDAAMGRHLVAFHFAATDSGVIFDLALGRCEGIADGDVDILMGLVLRPFAIDGDLLPGEGDIQSYSKQITLPVMAMILLDDNPAFDDPVEESLQFVYLLTNTSFDGGRGIHVPKCDIERLFHRLILTAIT
jgi:hypothetical protein